MLLAIICLIVARMVCGVTMSAVTSKCCSNECTLSSIHNWMCGPIPALNEYLGTLIIIGRPHRSSCTVVLYVY